MRLLLFGGWGQLGSDLTDVASERHQVLRPRRAEADVTDPSSVRRAAEASGADVVVDAAAFHQLERCEADPLEALRVNAVGAANVARAADEAGARFVLVSTDYVFDGGNREGYGEDDQHGPVNAYGVSKSAAERLARLACADTLIVRGSGMFGHAGSSGKGGNFVETMLRKAAAGERISVVDDLEFSPTATRDMAERLVALLEVGAPAGAYHLANAGRCTWFGFAQAVFELAGLRPRLEPRASDDATVRRPPCSVLNDTRTASLGMPAAAPWREALARYLATRSTAGSGAGAGAREGAA